MLKKYAVALFLILALGAAAEAQKANGAVVTGTVVDRQGRQAPGLMVFLVTQHARTGPVTSDRNGQFFFTRVPLGQVYYVEVYWGKDLMYRKPVKVDRDTNLGVIRL